MVVLFGPGAQFHAKTFGTASIADCREAPNRSIESVFTFPATKRKNPYDTAELSPDAAYLRKTQMFRSALRTGNKSHFLTPFCAFMWGRMVNCGRLAIGPLNFSILSRIQRRRITNPPQVTNLPYKSD